jgi:putative signal transducing protein
MRLPDICYAEDMKSVFDASSNIEAHLVVHQLQQAGIEAAIQGEFLQGGIGELPAAGNIRVMVGEDDVDEARQVIADWDAAGD